MQWGPIIPPVYGNFNFSSFCIFSHFFTFTSKVAATAATRRGSTTAGSIGDCKCHSWLQPVRGNRGRLLIVYTALALNGFPPLQRGRSQRTKRALRWEAGIERVQLGPDSPERASGAVRAMGPSVPVWHVLASEWKQSFIGELRSAEWNLLECYGAKSASGHASSGLSPPVSPAPPRRTSSVEFFSLPGRVPFGGCRRV